MIWVIFFISSNIKANPDVTAFGTVLGSNKGIFAYSNGNSDFISEEFYENVGIFYGMKWQCVEYARRWLIGLFGISFGRVEAAEDIWSLEGFVFVENLEKVSIEKVENGSGCKPEVGNVVIYGRGGKEIPYGHVAIVVDVGEFGVRLAEQNWENDYWPGDYSREINFTVADGRYYLIDEEYPVLGWIEYPDTYSSCTKQASSSSNTPKPASTTSYLI